MYKNPKDIHIGKMVEAELKASGKSYAQFARELNIDRTTVYSLLKSKSIDIERLIKICQILNVDLLRNAYLHDDIFPTIYLGEEQIREIIKYGGITISITPDKPISTGEE